MNHISPAWLEWWNSSDWIIQGVFVSLIFASFLSWTVMLYKWWQISHIHRQEESVKRGLAVSQLSLQELDKIVGLQLPSKFSISVALSSNIKQINDRVIVQANLTQVIYEQRLRLENGLTILASIGSSAPFIGLFGTVWGIMHALQGLGSRGALTMDLVAGPVAEALVATAVGLFAAIPAVMGYNMLVRRLRRLMVTFEGNNLQILNRLLASEVSKKGGL
jgi:biopolymer transport protein ExbB